MEAGERSKQLAEVAASTGTDKVRIVSRRANTNSLGSPTKEVAHFACQILQDIGGTRVKDPVPDGEVVRLAGCLP